MINKAVKIPNELIVTKGYCCFVVMWRLWLDESSTIVRLKVPVRNLVPVWNLLFDLRLKKPSL